MSTTQIEKGSEVRTSYGWAGVVEAVDLGSDWDRLAFVTDTDENGRVLHSGWVSVANLTLITADSIVIPEAK
jgi:hypothetical protein